MYLVPSLTLHTFVSELKDGEVSSYTVNPGDFSLQCSGIDAIKVAGAAESLAMVVQVLDNVAGAARDIVALNAGAAIYVGGKAATHSEGVALAHQLIADGSARNKLKQLVECSNAQ